MNKIDALLDLLTKIYVILSLYHQQHSIDQPVTDDQGMTRQQVKDYLGISETTYKRKVREGVLKPTRMPGGDRFFKNQLLSEFEESKRRGRV